MLQLSAFTSVSLPSFMSFIVHRWLKILMSLVYVGVYYVMYRRWVGYPKRVGVEVVNEILESNAEFKGLHHSHLVWSF